MAAGDEAGGLVAGVRAVTPVAGRFHCGRSSIAVLCLTVHRHWNLVLMGFLLGAVVVYRHKETRVVFRVVGRIGHKSGSAVSLDIVGEIYHEIWIYNI